MGAPQVEDAAAGTAFFVLTHTLPAARDSSYHYFRGKVRISVVATTSPQKETNIQQALVSAFWSLILLSMENKQCQTAENVPLSRSCRP